MDKTEDHKYLGFVISSKANNMIRINLSNGNFENVLDNMYKLCDFACLTISL